MKYSCRVVVKGRLGREWSRFFDGWRVVPQRDGTTLLEGTSVDGTSLQGLLDSLRLQQIVYARCVYPKSEHSSPKVAAVSTGVRLEPILVGVDHGDSDDSGPHQAGC